MLDSDYANIKHSIMSHVNTVLDASSSMHKRKKMLVHHTVKNLQVRLAD